MKYVPVGHGPVNSPLSIGICLPILKPGHPMDIDLLIGLFWNQGDVPRVGGARGGNGHQGEKAESPGEHFNSDE